MLDLEHCRCSLDKERILFDIVEDEEMQKYLCLLNDIIGLEVRFFQFTCDNFFNLFPKIVECLCKNF